MKVHFVGPWEQQHSFGDGQQFVLAWQHEDWKQHCRLLLSGRLALVDSSAHEGLPIFGVGDVVV